MENLVNVENKITSLRNQMHKLIHKNSFITTSEVVNVSQKLDEALNQYYKITHKIN
ncbi:aspartyl-phosphate phosphatase Spo0E family protein [Senegalia massiliensis]|uniref:Aspartyl-phosphate phosphatase Spo0E family protein n=2 Tax=Senegalia massiliensis TaxID=1720316 RepID=A0A845R203_9CLOT|nr:aspartyl-phosphate phosphatase Spo0E family protein [Senegalia massiliensis]NBI07746.1 aspartyl-phosphate phosphatase Spo0E family protein [Senegalia massiliensis]